MAWLRKIKGLPGGAPGGLIWTTAEDVVEVEDDELANKLLQIPDAGFISVAEPEPEPVAEPKPVVEAPTDEKKDAPAPAKKTAAKTPGKTAVQE